MAIRMFGTLVPMQQQQLLHRHPCRRMGGSTISSTSFLQLRQFVSDLLGMFQHRLEQMQLMWHPISENSHFTDFI
ncbi:hypothetical protein CAEBREN_24322 [Caenorhabditis brenneri]|uniref:Uncharacterized protein n=1 Tax=Caenorhabditis brenneri TaxID=135651 RepID=G0P8U4_CAEBE|nr:hypothetical protein CAEBREN_24322 [Caenorhabditis brenneri]